MAAAAMPGGRTVTLKSKDGKVFQVSEAAARRSTLLKELIDATEGDIPVPEVTAATLEKVIQYLTKHAAAAADADRTAAAFREPDAPSEDLEMWDAQLVDGLGTQDALFDLIHAADYLDIDGLLDAACKKIADMMKGKTPEQIRDMFGIPDDYTEEEKEELRKEYAWAFPQRIDADDEEEEEEQEEEEEH